MLEGGNHRTIITLVVLAWLLSACGNNVTPTPTAGPGLTPSTAATVAPAEDPTEDIPADAKALALRS